MSVAVRSASSGSQTENLGVATVTAPTGLTAGDLLVAVACVDNDDPTTVITAPSDWAPQGTDSNAALGSTAGGIIRVFLKQAGSSEPGSYDFDRTTGGTWIGMVVHVLALTGAAPATFIPGFGSGSATTSQVAPAVPGAVGGLLVCGFTAGNAHHDVVDATGGDDREGRPVQHLISRR
jgi:hypothetical protein